MIDCRLENKNYQNCDNFLDLKLMNIINAKNEKLSMHYNNTTGTCFANTRKINYGDFFTTINAKF